MTDNKNTSLITNKTMRNSVILSAALIITALTSFSLSADDLTSSEKALRSNIVIFLKTEGFSPYIDEYGDVNFKREGELHYISILDEDPFYIEIHRAGYNTEELSDEEKFLELVAINCANVEVPAAKAMLIIETDTIDFAVEAFITDVQEFRSIFYDAMDCLKDIEDTYLEYRAEVFE